MIINSKQNKNIKFAYELKQKKARKLHSLFLVEGKKILQEVVNEKYKIHSIFCTEENFNFCKKINNDVLIVSSELIKHLSSTVTPQGIIAVVEQKHFSFNAIDNFVLLDRIQDPSNMGAIIRSAVATNVKNILALNCVDYFNEKVIRASAGTIFKANLFEIEYSDLISLQKSHILLSADMNGENVFELGKLNKNFGLIIGNEGNGISEDIISLINKNISIPMQNNVESLNASVSAGIILYQLSIKK